ncbi:uncharacterized protein LOC114361223 [Ostrinia furnacalis]|uniref:uncharacterized protein LOC114361223 n=1 Tax=Ostrinia furnacalis TaxID=93504 RepID=UPI00103F1313|nr:uncharacterized protein LOC114361223 [Ostrinia furnacalis]
MLALKARFGEPLEQYFYSKLNLLNRCQIKGRQAVDCILHGIEDRGIRLGAQAAQFDFPEQVLKYLKTVKVGNSKESISNSSRARFDKRQTASNTSTSSRNNAGTSKPPIKCFNCGMEGHPSFLCKKPIEKCTNCHMIGHRITSCPNVKSDKSKNNDQFNSKEKQVLRVCVSDQPTNEITDDVRDASPSNKESIDESSKNKYYMTVEVDHKPLECYVDLGSECSLIRYTDALQLGAQQCTKNLPLLRGIGNNCIQAISCIMANVNVQGITLLIEMYVVGDDAIKQPVLLGQNFTEHPCIMITKTPSQLIFEDSASTKKICLTIQETVIIPQQEIKAIPVISSELYSGRIYVHGSVRGKAGSEYFLLPGEYELIRGKGKLLVQNVASSTIKFMSNSLTTRSMPVSSTKEIFNLSKDLPVHDDNLNCGNLINDEQKRELQSLLCKYADCFSTSLKDLGFTSVTEMEIQLSDTDPIVYRPYRMPLSERTLVRDMVQEMLDANIVRESSSPYASSIVLVKKKTGEKRLCIDYRALNRKTIKDHYPLPRVEDQLDLLSGHKFFITLDLASGYYQIPIKEDSRHKTAFVTPDGQFEYLRMPFGLVNAPSVFQRTINKILAEAKIKCAMVYMDDVLIPAHDFAEGLTRLQEVLDLLRAGGLTLKMSKCYFFYEKIDYLGFEVGSDGIRPGLRKTEATFHSLRTSMRIARWWVQLQEFDCRFEYRPGARMAHVDALSRNPVAPAISETHVLDVLVVEKDDWISTVHNVVVESLVRNRAGTEARGGGAIPPSHRGVRCTKREELAVVEAEYAIEKTVAEAEYQTHLAVLEAKDARSRVPAVASERSGKRRSRTAPGLVKRTSGSVTWEDVVESAEQPYNRGCSWRKSTFTSGVERRTSDGANHSIPGSTRSYTVVPPDDTRSVMGCNQFLCEWFCGRLGWPYSTESQRPNTVLKEKSSMLPQVLIFERQNDMWPNPNSEVTFY